MSFDKFEGQRTRNGQDLFVLWIHAIYTPRVANPDFGFRSPHGDEVKTSGPPDYVALKSYRTGNIKNPDAVRVGYDDARRVKKQALSEFLQNSSR